MLFPSLTVVEEEEPHGAALNMALDEALLAEAAHPLLRFYTWARPALSFGYFGRWAEVELRWPERELVRRWTGGGAVEHGEDVTYSLLVPRGHPVAALSAPEAYARIHRAVAEALGGGATLAHGEPRRLAAACFENPVAGDVLLGAGKVAGAAQRRTRPGLLHQGSVQVPGERGAFCRRLARALSGELAPGRITPADRQRAALLAEEKYGSLAWLRKF